MSLDNVSIQQCIRTHTPLQVDQISRLEFTQIGFDKRLVDRSYGIARCIQLDNSQTDSIMSNALINTQFVRKRGFNGNVLIALIFTDGNDTSCSFNDS